MKHCAFCKGAFTPKHGNQRYCSTNCNRSQKAATQQKLYGILKEFRKGFLGNYRLFEQLLPKTGKKTYPLAEINNKGFIQSCYFQAYTDMERNTWYTVSNYSFSIHKKENQNLFITLTNK